jgi:hypothetical protein
MQMEMLQLIARKNLPVLFLLVAFFGYSAVFAQSVNVTGDCNVISNNYTKGLSLRLRERNMLMTLGL